MLVSDKMALRRDGELGPRALGAICIDVLPRGGVSEMVFMLSMEGPMTVFEARDDNDGYEDNNDDVDSNVDVGIGINIDDSKFD